MKVIQLFTNVNINGMVKAYNRLYPSDSDSGTLTEKFYRETALPYFRNKVLITSANVVTIDRFETFHDDPVDDTDEIHVGWECEGKPFSMSFVPWSEILGAEFRSGIDLTDEDIAAHIFWELTWHGWESDTEEVYTDLLDRVEEVNRIHEAHEERVANGEVDKDSIPKGFVAMDDVFDSLYDRLGISEEEREDRRRNIEKRVANMRTARVFKNGIKFDGDQ